MVNAKPTSTCESHARIGPHHVAKTPNGAITSMNTAHAEATRNITNAT